jgi:transcription-repair coupling factor (superfamily II helicase)
MALTGLLSLVGAQAWMRGHLRNLERPEARATLTIDSDHQAVYVGALWHLQQRPVIVINPRLEDARRLHDQLLAYLGDEAPVWLLPEPEVLPFERLAVDARTGNQRLSALAGLASYRERNNDAPPPVVVASVASALRLTLPPELAVGRHPEVSGTNLVSKGDRMASIDALMDAWVRLGYRREPQVETPGCFSLRGGILDIYPTNAEMPYRVELWDDEIDTIRRFDPETQRSVEDVEGVAIVAAREQLPELCDTDWFDEQRRSIDLSPCNAGNVARFQEELAHLLTDPNPETLSFYNGLLNRHTLADYLPDDSILVLDRPNRLAGEAEEQEAKYDQQRSNRQDRGELPYGFPSPSTDWENMTQRVNRAGITTVSMERWSTEETRRLVEPLADLSAGLDHFTHDTARRVSEGGAVVAITQHASRLAKVLEEEGVSAESTDSLPTRPRPNRVYVLNGALSRGWQTEATENGPAVAVYSDAELFGTVKRRSYRPSRKRQDLGEAVTLGDLTPGAYVVHIDHGVAKFIGTTQLESTGDDREYLVLEYAGDDRLYVPTEQLDRIGAYVAATDQPPSLTRLGGSEWQRIKEKATGAAKEIAEELLRLYAIRETVDGHRFGPDAAWQQDLEDSFPYQETPDQMQAIDEVKNDMEAAKPMDRLICGDVGYGKTEVALRAAFKTINEGMQVAILVPTTVLAQQHYATFTERLAPYPVKVEVLSRFRTHKEQEQVVEAAKSGTVDIVIGTHRILQKDVDFNNLGLVIIDEEHRFGVAHKERLKQMRAEVDVMTLSATPIPRTLHMALAGVRDMSVIHTPPEARLPVKTFVSEDSAEPVREAILRELERDGQVFFLHNRVRTIHNIADELGKLVPEARILVGHGQMPEAELEDVMVAFANREADVLVCTTIIESGLDMPNVNTIIIDRADRFGLAQLYQLRGRVGRGDHRAYAYLLLPDNQEITEAASQRIHAILEANELGAGFRIAMRDLEIRGAGNLLGADQSGQIHAVGLNLYSELLNQAVQDLSDQDTGDINSGRQPPPRIDLQLAAYIPPDYIAHMPARLAFYQRLSNIADRTQIPAVQADMEDRFGPIPQEVSNLLAVTDLRCLGTAAGAESISSANDGIITVVFRHPVGDARQALQNKMGRGIRVGRRDMEVRTAGDTDFGIERLGRALRRVASFVDEMRTAMEAAAESAQIAPDPPPEAPARSRRRRRPARQPVAAD